MGGTTTDTTYDKVGNRLTLAGPHAAGEAARVDRTIYDALERPVEEVTNYVAGSGALDANLTTRTAYDAAGNVLATVDPRGTVTRYVLNARGLATSQIANCTNAPPASTPADCTGTGTHTGSQNVVTDYSYDGAGAVVTSTVRGATTDVVTRTAYDALGRVTKVILDEGTGRLNLPTEYAYGGLETNRRAGVRVRVRDADELGVALRLVRDAIERGG